MCNWEGCYVTYTHATIQQWEAILLLFFSFASPSTKPRCRYHDCATNSTFIHLIMCLSRDWSSCQLSLLSASCPNRYTIRSCGTKCVLSIFIFAPYMLQRYLRSFVSSEVLSALPSEKFTLYTALAINFSRLSKQLIMIQCWWRQVLGMHERACLARPMKHGWQQKKHLKAWIVKEVLQIVGRRCNRHRLRVLWQSHLLLLE